MKNSEFLKLGKADFWKGLLLSVLTAGVTAACTALTSASTLAEINWQGVGIAAAGAFLAYIIKNLLTNEQGEILKK